MLEAQDHRRLGERLDLFHFQEEAPGMAFWHPDGSFMYRKLEECARRHFLSQGYREVRTPQILRRSIWEKSGHWTHYQQGIFRIADAHPEAAVKPVNCPGHIQILQRDVVSWRDLPVRFAEFGMVHRDEPGGTLHGLMRLQQFTQDDGHVFCRMEQAPSEVVRFIRSVPAFYAKFGFRDLDIALSLRPKDRAGTDEQWDLSEAALREALDEVGVAYRLQPEAGAFYGPKIEFALRDRQGRDWQCATIQFDLVMPRSFDVGYISPDGSRVPCVMLHRALYGSLERFLGVLLEQHGSRLPAWLCPIQVRILPVGKDQEDGIGALREELQALGLRVDADVRKESLARRVAECSDRAIPWIVIRGAREEREKRLVLRDRDGAQRELDMEDAFRTLAQECAEPD